MNEQRVLSRVTTGMRVVDVAGSEIGTVDLVQRDDPNAVTVQAPTTDPGSSLNELIEATAVEEPDVPADLAARLRHSGYLKVSTDRVRTGAVYVPADQIAAVTDAVRLEVPLADLPAEE
ncbi:hypothetical protein [Salinispora tropica]|uniref:PRC-barrel domain-containing protein n=1 Tax=Salinispora tropica (strain ATCC BAA-916 / DSM 44818 / JCM 13857 / NBRC 105044 / CNB-440) TaxID=369723 RepID=A4XC83_SALTO|nr:hypothetical protein [Salinispora tropica]ABP56540.1 hypothetical protein Strop_4110 [Salinispora tropica CNB-440]